MRILTYTTLYPNNVNPNHGVFIKERMTRVAKYCELKLVAPIPYFPAWKRLKRWYHYSRVLRKEQRDGLEVYHPRYFITPKLGMNLYGWLMYRSTLNTVECVHETFPFDVIDAHYIYPDGLAAVLIGKKLNKPVILSARGTDINLYPKFPLIRRQIVYTLSKADKIIAVCQALKDKMIEFGISASKITVIPNGVDVGKFFPVCQSEARRKLNLPLDKTIILSVGGLIERKGFHYIIDAIQILKSKLSKDELPLLIIVGEGEHRATLEKQIDRLGLHSSVVLTGRKLHNQLYLWYNACDIFCLASSREGWPNVLFEALACGKPVVATKIWGTPEVICSEEYGVLVEKQDGLAIAQAIMQALEKDWNYNKIINYANQNTWDKVAEKVYYEFKTISERKHNKN